MCFLLLDSLVHLLQTFSVDLFLKFVNKLFSYSIPFLSITYGTSCSCMIFAKYQIKFQNNEI